MREGVVEVWERGIYIKLSERKEVVSVLDGAIDSRTKKEEKKGAKKEEQRKSYVQQRRQGKISWVGHVFAKGKRVDESPFQLFKIYFPPLHNLIF